MKKEKLKQKTKRGVNFQQKGLNLYKGIMYGIVHAIFMAA